MGILNRRRTWAAIGAGALLFASASASVAITGGTVDEENIHSNVGMIVFYDADDHGRYRCSATLVSPTVLLTAAHCTFHTLGKTIVTFDWHIADAPPSGIPRATDDTGTGTSSIGYQESQNLSETHTFYAGQAIAHPDYSQFTDLKNWNDVGVVVLSAPVTGITPAQIAPLGYLDQFTPNLLGHELFTLVGYGTEVRKPDGGPQKPTPESYPLVRRFTDEVGQKLMDQILQTNGNPNDTRGGGGTCFGDSGGPSFNGGKLTTVTSYGRTANCRYIGGLQRVDIPSVQNWLDCEIGLDLDVSCAPAAPAAAKANGNGAKADTTATVAAKHEVRGKSADSMGALKAADRNK